MSEPSAGLRIHPLDARIPPPLVLAALALAMWVLARLWPAAAFVAGWTTPAAIALAMSALAIELAAGWRFLRAKTTVDPRHPERTVHLVTDGLHRISRNPMYVGQVLLLLAWALRLAHPAAFLLALVFPLYITRFQILPEERALAARFGTDYVAYRARVRRWL
jgi:protein-S-isoprenylcysteine O-methyltransferase Ste14